MRLHEDDIVRRKPAGCLELATLGIRLYEGLVILVFKLELLAYLEAIRERTCDTLGSTLRTRVLDLANHSDGSNG